MSDNMNDDVAGLMTLFAGLADVYGTYDHNQTETSAEKGKVEIKSSAKTISSTAVTPELWRAHVAGDKSLGIVPITRANTCIWGVIDIDTYDLSHADLYNLLERKNLPLFVCRSKSGGAHLFLFASEPMPAGLMQDALRKIAKQIGYPKAEVFPKQSELQDKDSGSWLNIPYFGGNNTDRYCVNQRGLAMSLDMFLYLAEQRRQSPTQIEELARRLADKDTKQDRPATLTEFEAWFAGALLRLESAAAGDADNAIFRLCRDCGRWASVLGLSFEDFASYEQQARDAAARRGKTYADFDEQWYRKSFEKGRHDGNPPRRTTGSRMEVISLANIEPRPIDWLWPKRIAKGKLTVVAGMPGVGKSQLTLDLAARVTTGSLWPFDEGRAPCGRVLLLSAEDGPDDTIVPRLLAAGADLEMVGLVQMLGRDDNNERTFDLGTDLPELDRELGSYNENDGYVLVIVDPITAYMGDGSKGKADSHRNTDVRAILAPLARLAEKYRVAILCVTHPAKNTGRKALLNVMGSLAFVAAARTVLLVDKEEEEQEDDNGNMRMKETGRRIVAVLKNNIGPDGPDMSMAYITVESGDIGNGVTARHVVWEGKVNMSADDLVGYRLNRGAGEAKNTKKDQAKAMLRRMLKHGPVEVTVLEDQARAEGISHETLKNARKELNIVPYKTGGLHGPWVCCLPGRQEDLPL